MAKLRGPEKVVREIKRKTRRKFSSEEKIRIVLEGLHGEETIAELCLREGISPNLYYNWSMEFLEAGKRCPRTTVSRPLAAKSSVFAMRTTAGCTTNSADRFPN